MDELERAAQSAINLIKHQLEHHASVPLILVFMEADGKLSVSTSLSDDVLKKVLNDLANESPTKVH